MKSVSVKVKSAAALLLLLLVSGVYATQEESGASDYQNQIRPADLPAGAATSDAGKEEGQKEDILDRAFEPLDKAVSDINKTINKEGDGEASDPDK